ncbi:MAG: hypothetical protein Q4F75_08305 [Pseudomonadota bacterium]|nr:hypothetical protein [Pseudomonadota bacterium]
MNDMPIYYASDLNVDTCMSIAMFLFETSRNSGLTITEAAVRSGLTVNDIDELETQAGHYNFEKITKLLDLYKTRLPMLAKGFKRMPKTLADKYFEN